MKKSRWIFLLCLAVTLASAANGFSQCNPNPFKPDLRPPCSTIADRLTQAHEAAQEYVRAVDELNKMIASARSRYWKAFPNGPGSKEAELAFADALWQKDFYYLQLSLMEGVDGKAPILTNFADMMGGGNVLLDAISGGDAWKKFPTNVDNGIQPYAFPLFVAWANALRRAEGREKEGTFATPLIIVSAIQDKSNWRKAYEDARNWAEFMSSGLDLPKYVTPQIYLLRQMEADVILSLAAAKPAELPDPTATSVEMYNLLVKMFGEREVLAAAGKVLHTPKNSVGGLAKRADVAIGPYFMLPHPSPYLLFLTEVTNASPRNYAISLCIDAYGLPRVLSREKWADAYSVYGKLNAKYGEANVIVAATRVKAAPKDSEGRLKGDPQYNGQLYWLDTLLKNPKATLPGAIPHFRAGSYDPRWLGKTVEVRGTVARVDVERSGSPRYATIHFKESGAVMGFSPHSDMLQEMYGEDLSGLIGKVVEVYGEVTPRGVRIIDRDQVKVLDASALGPDFKDSRPDWLTAAKPAETLADNPQYLAWKKFPPGTTIAYVDRVLSESEPGSNMYTRSKTGRTSLRLDSIDDKQAVLTVNSTVYQMNGRASSSERQINYQAKQPPGLSGTTKPNESGQETLEISGKKIPAHWETAFGILAGTFAQPDKENFVKTWTSDEVAGGLVLRNKQESREILQGKPYRNITQTILETVENVEPELGGGSKQAAATPATKPAAPNPAVPSAASASQPVVKTVPPSQAPPAPVRATPPAFRPSPQSLPNLPPELARQVEFSRHFSEVMAKVGRAKGSLAQRKQSGSGTEVPADVRDAADGLDAQIQAVAKALGTRDNGLAEQKLHAVEDTLTVIQQFLAK